MSDLRREARVAAVDLLAAVNRLPDRELARLWPTLKVAATEARELLQAPAGAGASVDPEAELDL